MSSHVTFKLGGDTSGFDRAAGAIEKRVHGMSHRIGDTLKESFVGLVGAGSIGLLVENMISYAESITRASERLGIATDRIQQLRVAARHAGKDLDAFDAVFRNLDKSLSKSLVPGSKEANIAEKLGLSENDRAHLNKDDALKKMLENTKGMSRTNAEQLLGGMVGPKNAGWLLGNREAILSGKGNLVDDKALAQLVEFKHNLEDLTDVIRVALIPALTSFVTWLTDTVAQKVTNEKDLNQMDAEAAAINSNKGGKEPSWWARTKAELSFENKATGIVTGTPEEKSEFFRKAKEDYITTLYGADTYKELMKTFTPPPSLVDKLKEARDARAKEREDEQKSFKAPVNREAPVTKDTEEKLMLDKELKGKNEFLSIGGLAGVDAVYRMQRLSEEANSLLRQIAKNTTPVDTQDNPYGDSGFQD
jgi:hypothetical protein